MAEQRRYFSPSARERLTTHRMPSSHEEHMLLTDFAVLNNKTIAYNNISPQNLQTIFQSTSHLINEYTKQPSTEGEMLPKTPQELEKAFLDGHSVVYALSQSDGSYKVVAHAAMWPLFLTDQAGIFEFGSWIVDAEHRHKRVNGLTLGELVAQNVIELVESQYPDRPVTSIATVKRMNSIKGLHHIGFTPISFHQHPFTSALTCTCSETSEHTHTQPCHHRRGKGKGELIVPDDIRVFEPDFVLPNGNGSEKIPCTLVCHNPDTLARVEEILGGQFQTLTGSMLGFSGEIGFEIMLQLKQFYSSQGVEI